MMAQQHLPTSSFATAMPAAPASASSSSSLHNNNNHNHNNIPANSLGLTIRALAGVLVDTARVPDLDAVQVFIVACLGGNDDHNNNNTGSAQTELYRASPLSFPLQLSPAQRGHATGSVQRHVAAWEEYNFCLNDNDASHEDAQDEDVYILPGYFGQTAPSAWTSAPLHLQVHLHWDTTGESLLIGECQVSDPHWEGLVDAPVRPVLTSGANNNTSSYLSSLFGIDHAGDSMLRLYLHPYVQDRFPSSASQAQQHGMSVGPYNAVKRFFDLDTMDPATTAHGAITNNNNTNNNNNTMDGMLAPVPEHGEETASQQSSSKQSQKSSTSSSKQSQKSSSTSKQSLSQQSHLLAPPSVDSFQSSRRQRSYQSEPEPYVDDHMDDDDHDDEEQEIDFVLSVEQDEIVIQVPSLSPALPALLGTSNENNNNDNDNDNDNEDTHDQDDTKLLQQDTHDQLPPKAGRRRSNKYSSFWFGRKQRRNGAATTSSSHNHGSVGHSHNPMIPRNSQSHNNSNNHNNNNTTHDAAEHFKARFLSRKKRNWFKRKPNKTVRHAKLHDDDGDEDVVDELDIGVVPKGNDNKKNNNSNAVEATLSKLDLEQQQEQQDDGDDTSSIHSSMAPPSATAPSSFTTAVSVPYFGLSSKLTAAAAAAATTTQGRKKFWDPFGHSNNHNDDKPADLVLTESSSSDSQSSCAQEDEEQHHPQLTPSSLDQLEQQQPSNQPHLNNNNNSLVLKTFRDYRPKTEDHDGGSSIVTTDFTRITARLGVLPLDNDTRHDIIAELDRQPDPKDDQEDDDDEDDERSHATDSTSSETVGNVEHVMDFIQDSLKTHKARRRQRQPRDPPPSASLSFSASEDEDDENQHGLVHQLVTTNEAPGLFECWNEADNETLEGGSFLHYNNEGSVLVIEEDNEDSKHKDHDDDDESTRGEKDEDDEDDSHLEPVATMVFSASYDSYDYDDEDDDDTYDDFASSLGYDDTASYAGSTHSNTHASDLHEFFTRLRRDPSYESTRERTRKISRNIQKAVVQAGEGLSLFFRCGVPTGKAGVACVGPLVEEEDDELSYDASYLESYVKQERRHQEQLQQQQLASPQQQAQEQTRPGSVNSGRSLDDRAETYEEEEEEEEDDGLDDEYLYGSPSAVPVGY